MMCLEVFSCIEKKKPEIKKLSNSEYGREAKGTEGKCFEQNDKRYLSLLVIQVIRSCWNVVGQMASSKGEIFYPLSETD